MISVIVPTYNRPQGLRRCLAALARQDLPRERFEVIVVDDGSSLPAQRLTQHFAARMDVRCIRQENAGPAAARNRGAVESRGGLLAFTDDDCAPRRDWLRAFVAAAGHAQRDLLGGQCVNAYTRNPFAETTELMIDYLRDHCSEQDGPGFFASNNIALPASAFHELGGFDTRFPLPAGEDRDFCERCFASGLRLMFVPGAQVRHAHRLTLRSFWNQHYRYGQGAAELRARLPQHTGALPRPAGFYTGLVLHPLRQSRTPTGAGRSALMLLAQVANAAGVFSQAGKSKSHKPRASRTATQEEGVGCE